MLLENSSDLSDDSCPGHQSHLPGDSGLSVEENVHPRSMPMDERGPLLSEK